jgi:hypothetical protein
MNLSIIYITSRKNPCINWFMDSLNRQKKPGEIIQIIIVDTNADPGFRVGFSNPYITQPKPTVWQGKHRLTKENWWAASNARNTGIALCRTEWIAFLDDRCVLMPGWMDSVREAMAGKYCVFGSYEKRHGMKVENGIITHGGIVTGEDSRKKYVVEHRGGAAPTPAPGEWAFGCTLALPLEWMLQINGYDEMCDGLSMEDVVAGLMLQNNNFDLRYDHRMAIVEDRTPCECADVMRREDKGKSPDDKSHALLNMLRHRKRAGHKFDLRKLRADILAGADWPKPWGPEIDFWDSQPIKDM